MDPQRSIFSRFRRTRALFPSPRLYKTVIKGHGQSEIDKNRLSRSNRVRRPLANTSLSYHAEDPRNENEVKKGSRGLYRTCFGAICVREIPRADIKPSGASKPPKISDLDQSDDLKLLQSNYYRASRIPRFRSKPDLDPQRSIFSRFRRTRDRFPSQTLY